MSILNLSVEQVARKEVSVIGPSPQPKGNEVPDVAYASCATLKSIGISEVEEDDAGMPTLSKYLRVFNAPGAKEVEESDKREQKSKLGTLFGVFLPTTQNIFGVVMFIRLPWVVGSAGIIQGLTLVGICCLCTFLTALSMSAIASNGVVRSGGSYFMISRNLGVELGTAIGLLFYLGVSFGCGMYIIGGCEILLDYLVHQLPRLQNHFSADGFASPKFNNYRIYGVIILVIVASINSASVKVVQLFAPVSLACVIVSILSIMVGSIVPQPEKVCLVDSFLLAYNKTGNSSSIEEFCKRVASNCSSCTPKVIKSTVPWSRERLKENLWPKYLDVQEPKTTLFDINVFPIVQQNIRTDFFVLLAVYFPSVTGILAGANLSGDLKNPQRSIPIGTIAAQLTTTCVYLLFILIYGATVNREVLLDKYGVSMNGQMVVSTLSFPSKWLVMTGSFTSTFGAALQCLCSAPRLLQSIAKDGIIPFARFLEKQNCIGEPFNALIVTASLALIIVLIGLFEHIAPLLVFFFLMCYAFVNIVVTVQSLLQSPNWRPRFKFTHWTLSSLGALLCFFIMFSTHWYYALVALTLCAGIYTLVRVRGAKREWGDGVNGLVLQTALYCLQNVREGDVHTKIWRPHILTLVKYSTQEETAMKNPHLLTFLSQLQESKILIIVANLMKANLLDAESRDMAKQRRRALGSELANRKVNAFSECYICTDMLECLNTVVQSAGIGKLRTNTVFIAWPDDWETCHADESRLKFLDSVFRVATSDKSLLVLRSDEERYPCRPLGADNTIDVWWFLHDGGLLVLLPVLLKKSRIWRHCTVRVFALAYETEDTIALETKLQKWFYDIRISVEVHVISVKVKYLTVYLKNNVQEKRLEAIESRLSRDNAPTQAQFLRYESALNLSSIVDLSKNPPVQNFNLMSVMQPPMADTSFTFTPGSDQTKKLQEAIRQAVTAEMSPPKTTSAPPPSSIKSAIYFQQIIQQKSSDASLVIMNLPPPPSHRDGLKNYFAFLIALTKGLDSVLFVRGTGREVITME